jgi:hypothetical protein
VVTVSGLKIIKNNNNIRDTTKSITFTKTIELVTLLKLLQFLDNPQGGVQGTHMELVVMWDAIIVSLQAVTYIPDIENST